MSSDPVFGQIQVTIFLCELPWYQ